jgi:hypothetical protein
VADDLGKWEGLEGLDEQLLAELRPDAEAKVRRAAAHFSGQIKVTLTGQRTGRRYRVQGSRRNYAASAPGEPPAVMLGNLRNSVGFSEPTWDGPAVSCEVGVGLGARPAGGAQDPATTYARRLELGGVDRRGVRILPRPYIEPTWLREEQAIDAILAAA